MTKKTKNFGFTLVEMLVVITIIAFMGLTLIPAIIGLFNSGTDSQSYAMLTGELAAARTLAIKTSCYVCVHIQQASRDADLNIPASINGKFYMAVLIRNSLFASTCPYADASGVNYGCYFYPDQVFVVGTLTAGGTTQLTASPPTGTWVANQWSGYWIRILSSSIQGASGQVAQICVPPGGNSSPNALPLTGTLNVAPASGDTYMIYKPSNIDPQVLPGTIAFGRLCPPFVVNGAFVHAALGDTSLTTANTMYGQSFLAVNIIFSPSGTVVSSTPDLNGAAYLATAIPTSSNSPTPLPGYFYTDPAALAYSGLYTQLWPMPSSSSAAPAAYRQTLQQVPTPVNAYDGVNWPQPGTTVVTMVDYTKYLARSSPVGDSSLGSNTGRNSYLAADNGGCPYLSINVNTGQMLPRK